MTRGCKKAIFRQKLRQTPTSPYRLLQTCTDQNKGRQRFRKFWVRSCHWRQNVVSDDSHATGFFVTNSRHYFVNFPTADFHQIWPRHVNPCPPEKYRKRFSKLFFRLLSFAPQTPKLKCHTYTLLWLAFNQRDVLQGDTVHSTLYYKAREFPNSRQFFRTTNGFKVPQFSFLLIFLPHKMPKSTFLCAAYSLCVTWLRSQAAQSRCTVVRPMLKSIQKSKIRPPVKS